MLNGKELGMGWYEFLRYFTFGFLRITAAAALVFSLFLVFTEPNFLNIYLAIVSATDLSVCIIMHRHLEKYSSRINDAFTYYFIYCMVTSLAMLFYSDFYDVAVNITAAVIFYLVNRVYFKNRSHIFVNKCNLLGKKL